MVRNKIETEQEAFWKGSFGDEYRDRNRSEAWVASNCAFFGRALSRTSAISSILELGPNIGLNLMALRRLFPDVALSGVEINEGAAEELKSNVPGVDVVVASLLGFETERRWDVVFTKGVLIHINPDMLSAAYDVLFRCARRYILISEYYNPSPVEVVYRGHQGRLFKRDFAGEMLERYGDLSLIDYGFVYRRDVHFPQDDMTWFLLEKRSE